MTFSACVVVGVKKPLLYIRVLVNLHLCATLLLTPLLLGVIISAPPPVTSSATVPAILLSYPSKDR